MMLVVYELTTVTIPADPEIGLDAGKIRYSQRPARKGEPRRIRAPNAIASLEDADAVVEVKRRPDEPRAQMVTEICSNAGTIVVDAAAGARHVRLGPAECVKITGNVLGAPYAALRP